MFALFWLSFRRHRAGLIRCGGGEDLSDGVKQAELQVEGRMEEFDVKKIPIIILLSLEVYSLC